MMNKLEFLDALKRELSGFPEDEIKKSTDYYSEMVDERIDDGMTEEDAVAAIGSVDEIVSKIMSEISFPRLLKAKVKQKRTLKPWEIILIVLGSPIWLPLFVSAAIIILTVYIVLWSIIISLYAVNLSFAISGIVGIIASFAYIPSGNAAAGFLFIGGGLICAGVSILLFFGFNQITKGILNLSKKIIHDIKIRFMKRGEV